MTSEKSITSIEKRLRPLVDALTRAVGERVYHYWRPKMEPPYCVWQEDAEGSDLTADNHKREQSITGSIEYFTQMEYDPVVDRIQQTLSETENVSWSLQMVQYENETNIIHHSWDFRVL